MVEYIELTPEQAIGLLPDGDHIHNFGLTMIGADWDRASAIEAIREATYLALAGGMAYAMKHALCIGQKNGRKSFFATDMDALRALEEAEREGAGA